MRTNQEASVIEKKHLFEIDAIKAISILAVVLVHSINADLGSDHCVGKFLSNWTRFAVPGLLFASGFLFKKSGISFKEQFTKILLRILPPYLFCSFIILVFHLPGQTSGAGPLLPSTIIFNLIFGNVIGIYYFVFVISYLYMISFFIRMLPVFIIWGSWVCMLIITVFFYFHLSLFFPANKDLFFFILLRHPIVHVLPYLSGWLFSIYYQEVRSIIRQYLWPLMAFILFFDIVVLAAAQTTDLISAKQLFIQAHIYFSISFMLILGFQGPWLNRLIFFLSKNTYGIFLIHFPIVRYIQSLLLKTPNEFSFISLVTSWFIGIVGSLIVIGIAKRILGRYSLYIVGS